MKKLLLLLTLLALPGIFAASVTRNAPTTFEPQQEFTVSFTISDTVDGKEFTLEETIPAGLVLKEWTVTGAKESKSQIKTREKDGNFGWSFTTTGTTARISYTAVLSDNAPSAIQLQAVWFDTKGFNKDEYTITKGKTTPTQSTPQITSTQNPTQTTPTTTQPSQKAQTTPLGTKAPVKTAGTSSSAVWWIAAFVIVLIGVGIYIYTKKKAQ